MTLAPNPANEAVTVSFDLPAAGQVTIEVLEISSRNVLLNVNGVFEAGIQHTEIATSSLANGYYLVRVHHGPTREVQPLIIQR